MNYECDKCGKEFKYNSKLQEHLNNKTPCDKQKENLKCELCNIMFSRLSNKNRHNKSIKHINNTIIHGNQYNINTVNNLYNNIRVEIHPINTFSKIDFTGVTSNGLIADLLYKLDTDIERITPKSDDYKYNSLIYMQKFFECLLEIFKEFVYNPDRPQNHNFKFLIIINKNIYKKISYFILKDIENNNSWVEIDYDTFIVKLFETMHKFVNSIHNIRHREYYNNLDYILEYLNKYYENNIEVYDDIKKYIEAKNMTLYDSFEYNDNKSEIVNNKIQFDFINKQFKLKNGKEIPIIELN